MNNQYFNTTNLKGHALLDRTNKCKSQHDKILRLFEDKIELTPSEVYHHFSCEFPITSARRAINVLTEQGLLIKTDKTKVGIYGDKEFYWRKKF